MTTHRRTNSQTYNAIFGKIISMPLEAGEETVCLPIPGGETQSEGEFA
jgi:hypothetical protein